MSPRVELAVTDEQRLDCMAIRLEVFVDEQGVPFVLEIDARDHDPAVLISSPTRRNGRSAAAGTGVRPRRAGAPPSAPAGSSRTGRGAGTSAGSPSGAGRAGATSARPSSAPPTR